MVDAPTKNPIDMVIATGETHTVREFIEITFEIAGYKILWSGQGIDEVGRCAKSKKILIKLILYFRPTK